MYCIKCLDEEGFGPLSRYSDLTPCFVNGILANANSLMLLVVGAHQLYRLRQKPTLNTKFTWDLFAKMVLVIFQMATILASASSMSSSNKWIDIQFWSKIMGVLGLFVGFTLHYVERFKSEIPNGVLLFYWLFSLLIAGLNLVILKVRNHMDCGNVVIETFSMSVSAIVLFLEMYTQKFTRKAKSNPYDNANIFERLTFTWMTPLMAKGHAAFLEASHLPKLPEYLRSRTTGEQFMEQWSQQVYMSRKLHSKRPSLFFAISKSFGAPFLLGGLFKGCQDVLAFTQPQLLRLLIKFVNDYNKSRDGGAEPSITGGFGIVISMFVVSVLQTAMLHQYFQRAFDLGMKIKSSLTTQIYQKSLKLSNEARAGRATGDIVNLMSVDTQRLQDLVQNLQIVWSGPFQIILCLVSLHGLLGNAMWVGIVIMVVMIPANGAIARLQRKLQKVQMNNKDRRTRTVSEILNNMRSLKLYGWEPPFKAKLTHVRNDLELENLKKMGSLQAFSIFTFNCSPFLVSCATFAVFVLYTKAPLTTDLVFPALSLFNLLSFPLAVVPMVITNIVEAQVAVDRLTSLFTGEELQSDAVKRLSPAVSAGEKAVDVSSGSFVWTRTPYKPALTNINFSALKGQLACVVGRVGAGKSALLQAVLGQLHKTSGCVAVCGSVAYVAQTPWIMNATVRENILFGLRFDAEYYDKTVAACALEQDIATLQEGDMTLVGEKGISLSGGQKARLALARAVYARADVYLLDDVLSAVDEHVGKHLIREVLGPKGLLRKKCRLLTTNNLNVVKWASEILYMEDGCITERSGKSSEGGKLEKLLKEFGRSDSESRGNSTSDLKKLSASSDGKFSASSDAKLSASSDAKSSNTSDSKKWPVSDPNSDLNSLDSDLESNSDLTSITSVDRADAGAVNSETHEQGQVKWSVYMAYAKSCNPKGVLVFIAFLLLAMAASVSSNVWLKHWSEVNTIHHSNPHVTKYLGVYFGLGIGSSALTLCQSLTLLILCSIQGSKVLHSEMANAIFAAPMSFFETTPIGRILNRFSNDIYKIDEVLPRVFSMFFTNLAKVAFTIAVICFSTWQFVFVVLPLGLLYIYYQQYYLRTSRELRRLDSVSRSPIFAHFQESLNGVSTIRAYHQTNRFSKINMSRVDRHMSAFHPAVNANRWLAVRLEFLGSLVILGASGFGILSLKSGSITAGMLGLSVSYALQVTQSLNWIVRMTVEVEANIVSVERVLEYAQLPSEKPYVIEDSRPPAHWPSHGEVAFENYSARYRPGLDLVLKDISLKVKPHEKIGIVGRTGAGKSSLTLALFRIIEPASGSITIDDIRTPSLGLCDLRTSLSIIPQDAQVFEGTVRENLDPLNRYSDEQVWRALELAHLKDHVLSMVEDSDKSSAPLNAPLTEGGSNLSVGQKQLMCLARALLIQSKVLVLDEATAAVDVETDQVLQQTIRTEFKDRTILTIAHRLNTIMDSDKILVLDKGTVAEFDSPEVLLKNKESLFYSLCAQGGMELTNDSHSQ